jgi:hypothetical protein
MSIITLDTAKAQARVTQTGEDELLQQILDAAELHAGHFLNRNLYADNNALIAAIETAATAMAEAETAYAAAETTWLAADQTSVAAQLAWEKAQQDLANATAETRRTYNGMVLTDTVKRAVMLLFAHWSVNREAVVTETGDAIELPFGVTSLLELDRSRMGV